MCSDRVAYLAVDAGTGEHAREGSRWLDLGRNRAYEGNSRDVYQLADLLESDLGLATRDDHGHWLAGRRSSHLSTLARDLISDAELREQRGRRYRCPSTR
jgi:hypothetical protein